jgi:hypothetical protein
MARKGTTGESRAWFVPTIAAPGTGPTVAEITAGTDITPYLTRDGFDAPQSAQTIDASDASSRRDKSIPGNIEAGTVTLKGYRDSVTADDDFYTTLAQDTAGYIVVREFGGSTVAHAAAQKVDIYKGTVQSRSKQAWGDEAQKVVVTFAVEQLYEDKAVQA